MPIRPWAMVSWISRAMRCALVEHARLAGLGQQLRVQAGVLDRRRLQPRERLAALLVLLGDLLADEHAAADDDRLDADDREVEGPRLRRLRQAGDEAVHEDRRRADPDDRERERAEDRGVEEAADHEDEEDRLTEHEDRGEDQDPDEEDVDPDAVRPAAAPAAACRGRRSRQRRRAAMREGRQPEGRVRRPLEEAEDRRDREQHVAAPRHQHVAEALPRRLRRRAHAATLLQTDGHRDGDPASDASLPSERPDRDRAEHDRDDRHAEERRELRRTSRARHPGGPGRRGA